MQAGEQSSDKSPSTNRARLTQGPVGRHLVDLTLPMLIGISTMMAQNLLDAWFIAQVGDRELAAYSFCFPILMIVTSVAIGLGAGTSSVVARAVGADDHRRARRLATDSLLLSFLVTGMVCLLGVATIDPLFRLLGAPESMLPLIRPFMMILYSGVPFVVVGMVGMASMRAQGDARLPGKLMVLASLLNLVLDPLLIFGLGPVPELGLNGAATAALIARGTIFVITVWFMRYRLDLVSFHRPRAGELTSSWKDILHVGLPAAGTNMIVPLGAALVTAMLARFGPEAVAGFGVASRIETMVLVAYFAMSSIIGPFVGQNFSAGLEDRVMRSLWLTTVFCILSGLGIAIALALLSGYVPALFSDNAEVIRVTKLFLWIVPIGYGTYGMVMVMNAVFNGLGRPMPAVWISVSRILVLYVPLALVGRHFYGVPGIFAAYTLANVVTGLVAYLWARGAVRKLFAQAERVR